MVGLSPLARGTHDPDVKEKAFRRFIPAGAGNTHYQRPSRTRRPVYPRWRGEHNGRDTAPREANGLSPLARGTLSQIIPAIPSIRFIPAGAGNTFADKSNYNSMAVYPRWRGEHSEGGDLRNGVAGLSPLARGTRVVIPAYQAVLRFIPAGAGNTDLSMLLIGLTPVYPRWRGEHMKKMTIGERIRGLSPLARGTLHLANFKPHFIRFIPAGAGNTSIIVL
ncbi:CRISPR associated protein [Salmonella enterica subsp. enterica serovar Cerro]|nr:CRISPR associated protein of unknown function [Salmonella enterica subsp. enterica serovar Cerro]KMN26735.1 CRISPR associated protein [Salmonella enterica subsp. enterica serovar Cerro]